MTSYSHWGMFEYLPRVLVLPHGFKLSVQERAAMDKPGGIIMIERDPSYDSKYLHG